MENEGPYKQVYRLQDCVGLIYKDKMVKVAAFDYWQLIIGSATQYDGADIAMPARPCAPLIAVPYILP